MLECLHKSRLFLIIDLILFAKLLELLTINYSLSERRIIFVPGLLKFLMFWLLFNLHRIMHLPAVESNNAKSGFLWHSCKWDCRFGCFLQYMSGVEVLVYVASTPISMRLICSNYTLPWTTKFWGVFSKTDTM